MAGSKVAPVRTCRPRTRGRCLRSRRAWFSQGLLVAARAISAKAALPASSGPASDDLSQSPLTLLFYWDSVPNPDAPRGLCVLHVFVVANTRTRLSQSPYPPFQGGTSGLRAHQSACHRFAVLRPASDDALSILRTVLFRLPSPEKVYRC